MASASASTKTHARRRAAKRKTTRPPRGPVRGWWGEGPAPWDLWPGVSLKLEARWVKTRNRWESKDGLYYFDEQAGAEACAFFPTFLRHHKGEFAGKPFDLLPYQDLLIIRPVFGWKHAKGTQQGLRRFRKVLLAVPKGNGKSPLGSGTALYLTILDGEDGAEVYSAAADRMQAGIVFNAAKIMVEQSEELDELCNVFRGSIEYPPTRSYYQVLSADAPTKHGFNIHGLVFDEFHAQPTRDLYETLHRGTVKRRQPLTILLTTAGDDDETICYEEWDYARNVQQGKIDDETFLPVIFEATPEDDWQSEKVWRRVNPGYGVTVRPEAIAVEAHAAAAEPRKRNDFLRYHCNRWVNQATAWLPIEWWDRCQEPLPPDAYLAERPCAVGIDMSQKIDLTAAVYVFRLPLLEDDEVSMIEVVAEEGGDFVKRSHSLNYRIAIVPRFWLPEETLLERTQKDRVPYDQWHAQGLLYRTPGAIIDSDSIVREVAIEGPKRFPKLKGSEVGYDPAFATEIAVLLQRHGFTTVEVLQNYTHLSEACQVFEALVKARRVVHDGNRLLRWNVENVAIRRDDAGRVRPVKPRRTVKRIDGVVATIIALSRIIRQSEDQPPPWDGRVMVLD